MGVAVRVRTSTLALNFLIFSLWAHAEPMFLVDDQQAKFTELNILG